MSPPDGSPALIKLIRDKINDGGPVSFAWFMEQALYHPTHGYYSSGRARIGRCGDYFTNVSVSALFGRMLAAQFAQMWEQLGRPDEFTIVEQGAHDGQFTRDVLGATLKDWPEFFAALRYRIVEPFRIWQERQFQMLEERDPSRSKNGDATARYLDKVEWHQQLDQPFVGIHFSNELLDAMPVNLRAKAVGLVDDELTFIDGPAPEIAPNHSQLKWVDHVAATLRRGFVITIDYGFACSEFREVVQARSEHRALESPFQKIGHADITAHVDWTDIARRAQENDLKLLGFTDQHHALTGIIADFPDLISDRKDKPALQTLLHPEMLGRAFQLLWLGKEVDPGLTLSGLKFGRDPRTALNL